MLLQSGSDSQNSFLLMGIGFVALVAWLQTKRRVIKITSYGAPALSIDVKRMTHEKSEEFMDRVQQTKAKRIGWLFKPAG